MKFLEKPEAQPDLPLASHERSGEGEGIFAPPFTTHPEPCAEEASHDDVSLEFDPTHGAKSARAPSLSLHTEQTTSCTENAQMGEGEKDKKKSKEMESVNNENSSEKEGMILEDNETGPEDEKEEEISMNEIQALCMAAIANLRSMKEEMATKADFKPFKDMVNEFENRTEISPTQEDVQPVRTVRVPAH